MRLKAYCIIMDAVDAAIEAGYARAHKHADNPDRATIIEVISNEIGLALDRILDFGDD